MSVTAIFQQSPTAHVKKLLSSSDTARQISPMWAVSPVTHFQLSKRIIDSGERTCTNLAPRAVPRSFTVLPVRVAGVFPLAFPKGFHAQRETGSGAQSCWHLRHLGEGRSSRLGK